MTDQKRLVLDANILLRAVFGARVRRLLEAYEDSVAFYAPEVCFADARRYIPTISESANTFQFSPAVFGLSDLRAGYRRAPGTPPRTTQPLCKIHPAACHLRFDMPLSGKPGKGADGRSRHFRAGSALIPINAISYIQWRSEAWERRSPYWSQCWSRLEESAVPLMWQRKLPRRRRRTYK